MASLVVGVVALKPNPGGGPGGGARGLVVKPGRPFSDVPAMVSAPAIPLDCTKAL